MYAISTRALRNYQALGSRRLDAPPCNLSPVEASERRRCNFLILASLYLFLRCCKDNLNVAGMTLIRIDATVSAVRAAAGFLLSRQVRFKAGRNWTMKRTGACCTTMFLMTKSSTSKFFASAFDSAFFRRRVMNLTDFSGQRPKTQV